MPSRCAPAKLRAIGQPSAACGAPRQQRDPPRAQGTGPLAATPKSGIQPISGLCQGRFWEYIAHATCSTIEGGRCDRTPARLPCRGVRPWSLAKLGLAGLSAATRAAISCTSRVSHAPDHGQQVDRALPRSRAWLNIDNSAPQRHRPAGRTGACRTSQCQRPMECPR